MKMHVYGNHKPQIRGTDEGIWARLHKTDWSRIIPPEQRDPLLSEKLRGEAPGILAWAVRGCLEWQRLRLAPPEAVIASSAEYRAEMDPFADFFEAATVVHPRAWVQNADLREAYRRWSGEDDDRRLPSPNQFAERLRQFGAVQKVRKIDGVSVRGWEGIGLKAEVAEDAPTSAASVDGYSGYTGYSPVQNLLTRAPARAHETLSPSAVTDVTAVTEAEEEREDEEEEADTLDAAEAEAQLAALDSHADPFAEDEENEVGEEAPSPIWTRERGPVGEMLWYVTVAGVTGGGATQRDAVHDLVQTARDPVTDPAAVPLARRAAAREQTRLATEGEPPDPVAWLRAHRQQTQKEENPP